MSATMNVASSIVAAEDPTQTHHWLWPEGYEILYGGIASLLVFALLYWKAWPFVKKGLANRTARIQQEIDEASTARTDTEGEAARIRQALGDIDAERQRLFAEADAQAEALLVDGRRRLDAEVADLEAKAQADIAAAGDRSNDELRHEIVQLAGTAADRVAVESLDDATQQELIESFISRVGAGAQP